MGVLKDLSPKQVWGYFEEICQVPRPSKKEEKIREFLIAFAKENGLDVKCDSIGNVLITKEATTGNEVLPTIVLQSHMDMVCEKNNDTIHDFDKDAIVPYIDGEWVKAKGTTLGADDGIGMAAQMAILTSKEIKHGKIEALFTVDEETGLTGAFGLEPNFFTGKILLNLDSEDEGEIFIGCAGGIDTVIDYPFSTVNTSAGSFAVKVNVKGLAGGHSGDDIDKGRGNAIKILNRFVWECNNKYNIQLEYLNGGNLRNAIPRESEAVFVFDAKYKESVRVDFNIYTAEMERVWEVYEPNLKLELESYEVPSQVLSTEDTTKLLNALYAAPHGVFTMSSKMKGMVETSTNLAAIKFENNNIHITTSQRSDIESEKYNIAQMVASTFKLIGASVRHGEGYPGWAPNPSSPILKIAVESYEKLFKKTPIVRSIHAGLECGLILEKYPQMDMISFGPTLRGVHSPDEKIKIETVQMWWEHLVDIIENINKYE